MQEEARPFSSRQVTEIESLMISLNNVDTLHSRGCTYYGSPFTSMHLQKLKKRLLVTLAGLTESEDVEEYGQYTKSAARSIPRGKN